jgi:hypothetical protein
MPTTTNGLPYPASGDAPNGAAQIQSLAQAVETNFGGTTTTYTATLGWTNTTAAVTHTRLGNFIIVEFLLTLTGVPAGTFSMSLPFTGIAALSDRSSVGTAYIRDASATTNNQTGTVVMLSSTTVTIYANQDATAAIITPTNPITFASGDTIGGTLIYREV